MCLDYKWANDCNEQSPNITVLRTKPLTRVSLGNIWDPNHPIHLRWRKGCCFCVVHENRLWDVLVSCLASVEAGASASASICWTKGCLQSLKSSPLLSHIFMLYIKMLRVGEGKMNLTLTGTNSITIPQLFQKREARPVSVQSPYPESKFKPCKQPLPIKKLLILHMFSSRLYAGGVRL